MAEDAATVEQLRAENAGLRAENAVLRAEGERRDHALAEALEQKLAMAEILRVIASSATDLQTVLQTIVETAWRLSTSAYAAIRLVEDDEFFAVAVAGTRPGGVEKEAFRRRSIYEQSSPAEVIREGRAVHLHDVQSAEARSRYPDINLGPQRTTLNLPLLHDGRVIGVLTQLRTEVKPFSDGEIALLETFADQAAIAVSNAQLFQELQESNRQVSEALEQQTATAEVLRIIASAPMEKQPVLQSIAHGALRLCDSTGTMIRVVEGDKFVLLVHAGGSPAPPRQGGWRQPLNVRAPAAEAIREARTIHTPDVRAPEQLARYPETTIGAQRTTLHVPLLRDGGPSGCSRPGGTRSGRTRPAKSPCWRRSPTRPSSPPKTPACSPSLSSATPTSR
jgi:hypothetical protein